MSTPISVPRDTAARAVGAARVARQLAPAAHARHADVRIVRNG